MTDVAQLDQLSNLHTKQAWQGKPSKQVPKALSMYLKSKRESVRACLPASIEVPPCQ